MRAHSSNKVMAKPIYEGFRVGETRTVTLAILKMKTMETYLAPLALQSAIRPWRSYLPYQLNAALNKLLHFALVRHLTGN